MIRTGGSHLFTVMLAISVFASYSFAQPATLTLIDEFQVTDNRDAPGYGCGNSSTYNPLIGDETPQFIDESSSDYGDNIIDPQTVGGRTGWNKFDSTDEVHWYATPLDANSSYIFYWFYSEDADGADLDTGSLQISVNLMWQPQPTWWPNNRANKNLGKCKPADVSAQLALHGYSTMSTYVQDVTSEGIWADQTGRYGRAYTDPDFSSSYRTNFTFTPARTTWYFVKVFPTSYRITGYYTLVIRQLGLGPSTTAYDKTMAQINAVSSELNVAFNQYVENATTTTINVKNLFVNDTQITSSMLWALSATQVIYTLKDYTDPLANSWSFELTGWNDSSKLNGNLQLAAGQPIVRLMPDSELTQYMHPLPGLAVGLDRGAQVRLNPGDTWRMAREVRVLAIFDIAETSGTVYADMARASAPLFGRWNRRLDNQTAQWLGAQ